MIDYQPQKLTLTDKEAVAYCEEKIQAHIDVIRTYLIEQRLERIRNCVRNMNLDRGTHDCLTTDGLLDEYRQVREEFDKQLSAIGATLHGIGMLCCKADEEETK